MLDANVIGKPGPGGVTAGVSEMPEFVCFHDQDAACSTLEQLMWQDGPGCPHCGETHRLGRLNGLSTTVGTWKCYRCRRPFSVRSNSFFHNSHVQLHVWLQAIFLVVGSRHRITAQKLQTTLGVSLRTAWQMKQKIVARLAASDGAGEDAAIERISQICHSAPHVANRPPMSRLDANRLQRFLDAASGFTGVETEWRFFVALQALLTQRAPEEAAEVAETQEEPARARRVHAGAEFHASP